MSHKISSWPTESRWLDGEGDSLCCNMRRGFRQSYTGRNKHTLKLHVFWVLVAEYFQSPHKVPFQVVSIWKLIAKPSHRSLKIYPLLLLWQDSLWHLRAGTALAIPTQSFFTTVGSMSRRTSYWKAVFQWLVECIWHTECDRVFLALELADWKDQKTLLCLSKHVY